MIDFIQREREMLLSADGVYKPRIMTEKIGLQSKRSTIRQNIELQHKKIHCLMHLGWRRMNGKNSLKGIGMGFTNSMGFTKKF